MKTRTLLLLSVGTALMILVAGGVLLFQLSSQQSTSPATPLGEATEVGDATVNVLSAERSGDLLRIDIEVAGVDDLDGIDSFRLVTGDQRLAPVGAPADGRCAEFTVARQRCTVDFDVSAAETSSRVLVMRRGEEQSTWRLS